MNCSPRSSRRAPSFFGITNNYSPDSVFQQRYVEVDQEAYVVARQFEVGDHLGYVDRVYVFNGFQLDDHFVGNEQIHAVAAIDPNALVRDADALLTLAAEPPLLQLVNETALIRGLEKPRPKLPMHIDRRPDDALGNFVRFQMVPLVELYDSNLISLSFIPKCPERPPPYEVVP
jgi:hypothetical protein